MAPLVIGDTLGQKHRNYNYIVNNTKLTDIPEISYEESDLDNFIKIDIACRNENVEYVLKVLRSDDLLYVNRAIKKSVWLIRNEQYAHIINPSYLYQQLYPSMMPKAFNKLLLHIRLNLKDEVRAEEFFNYYIEYNLKVALKWLPLCSLDFVGKAIQRNAKDTPESVLRRLCKKSISFLDIYLRNYDRTSYKIDIVQMKKFTMKNKLNKYLEILDDCDEEALYFGPKDVKILMKNFRERVLKNVHKYSQSFSIIAKYIRREDMIDFILMNLKKHPYLDIWVFPRIFEEIVDRLPINNRFEFIKKVFMDKEMQELGSEVIIPSPYTIPNYSTSEYLYLWYLYAPFNTAFEELKKLIQTESKSEKRMAVLEVLLTTAKKNVKDLSILLQYYRKNHLHEPFNCKIKFIKIVLNTNTHRFDKETWECFNVIVSTVKIYKAADTLVQCYIRSIILYNIIHNENVPAKIEEKFIFDTFKSYQTDLTKDEKDKLFSYLFKYLSSKILNFINNENECRKNVHLVENVLKLLLDWNKELEDFPNILKNIKEICEMKKKNNLDIDLLKIYNSKKSWRRSLFSESIILSPTEQACINALKFRPELLQEFSNEVEAICLDNKIPTNQYFKKIRLYYPECLASNYKDMFMKKIADRHNAIRHKHEAIINGLFTLLPRHEIYQFLHQYAPVGDNFNSKSSKLEASICKHVEQSLHLVRPLLPLPTAMLYAKRLRHVLPSFDCIVYNTSILNARNHVAKISDAPVSLQQHIMTTAFCKFFDTEELQDRLSEILKGNDWTIRSNMFKRLFKNLCEARDVDSARSIFKLLSFFIDNSDKEDYTFIRKKINQIDQVPMWIRAELWMKTYTYFKTNPLTEGTIRYFSSLYKNMINLMEFLDDDFVTDIFLESFDDKFFAKRYEHSNLLAVFLMSTTTEEAHVTRFKKLLTPILERSFALWDGHDNSANVRYNLQKIFQYLDEEFCDIVLKKKMFLPIPMFSYIVEKLKSLNFEDNYVIITSRKLALDCVQSFDNAIKNNEKLRSEWASLDTINLKLLYTLAAVELGRNAAEHLKSDLKTYSSSVNDLFATSFSKILNSYKFNARSKVDAMKVILQSHDSVEGYLFVTELIPMQQWHAEDYDAKYEIIEKISNHTSKEVKMHYHLLERLLK